MIIDELIALLGFETKGADDLRQFNQGLDDAERKAQAVARRIDAMSVAIGGFLAGVGLEVGRRIGNFAKEFMNPWSLASEAAKPLDDLVKLADRTAFAFEALQEWQFAARQAGASAGEFQSSVQSMTRLLAEAARGAGRGKLALEAYGLSARTAGGDVKEADQFLLELADKIQTLSEAEALDLATKMGLSPGMLTLLKSGREEIEKLHAQAREGGLVFTEAEARQAEAYNDSLSLANQTITAMRHRIAVQFLPVLRQMLDRFSDWHRINQDIIRLGLERFGQTMARGFGEAVNVVQRTGAALFDVGRAAYFAGDRLVDLVSRVTGLNRTVAAGVLGAGMIGSTALGRAAMVALARRVPAIGALLLFEDLMSGLRGDDSYIGSIEGGAEALDRLREAFSGVNEALRALTEAFDVDLDWSKLAAPGDLINDALLIYLDGLTRYLEHLERVYRTLASAITSVREAVGNAAIPGVRDAEPDTPADHFFKFRDRNLRNEEVGPTNERARRGDRMPAPQPDPERFGGDGRRSRLGVPDRSRFAGGVEQADGMDDLRAKLQNLNGHLAKMSGEAVTRAVDATITDARQDNRQFPVTVNSTVNQTVQQATQAPGAAAQATSRAVGQAAVPDRAQMNTEPSF